MHYKKLIDRKPHIIEHFTKHNITDYEFIETYDKDELTEEQSSLFDINVTNSMRSLMTKMFYVYKEIADKYDSALILEDDVILSNSFTAILNKYVTQLPENYDMLFIGDGCKLHMPRQLLRSNKHVYAKCLYPTSWGGDGASRCTDSYIVNKKCAIKLCEYIEPIKKGNYKINLPSDWWLNVAARDNKFNVFWAEPTIVTQGTQNGLFNTSH